MLVATFLGALVIAGSGPTTLMGPAATRSPGAIELRWSAPKGQCPSRARFVRRIEDFLGRPMSEASGRHHFDVSVVSKGAGFVGTLTARTPEGRDTRPFPDKDCVVVAEAMAFVVAVAIDPGAEARATQGKPIRSGDPDERERDGEREART